MDYGYVEDIETEAADRIRIKIEERVGSFKTSTDAGKRFKKLVDENNNPSDYLDPVTESRGRFMYNLNTAFRIPIQWVTGDYRTAEQSFININTGGTPLSDQEVLYLKNRRSPVARAITGIAANGTKSSLWLKYKDECDKLSSELYAIILEPSDSALPDRVANYPLCLLKKPKNFERYLFLQNIFSVSIYRETGEDKLRKAIAEYADEADDNLLLFLAWVSRGSSEEILHRKIKFSLARDLFEEIWMIGKDSIFHAFGRKGAGPSRLTIKHTEILERLIDLTLKAKEKCLTAFEVLDEFLKDMDPTVHSDFVKQYQQDHGKPFGRFSESKKIQGEFLSLFYNATQRCTICGGRVLFGSHQVDHKKKRSRGGTSSHKNADLIHPFCNNHKDRLEGLKKCVSDTNISVNQQIDLQAPLPKPDSTFVTQLTFTFLEPVGQKST